MVVGRRLAAVQDRNERTGSSSVVADQVASAVVEVTQEEENKDFGAKLKLKLFDSVLFGLAWPGFQTAID